MILPACPSALYCSVGLHEILLSSVADSQDQKVWANHDKPSVHAKFVFTSKVQGGWKGIIALKLQRTHLMLCNDQTSKVSRQAATSASAANVVLKDAIMLMRQRRSDKSENSLFRLEISEDTAAELQYKGSQRDGI